MDLALFTAKVIITWANSGEARRTMSKCPFVIGSNVPGYMATFLYVSIFYARKNNSKDFIVKFNIYNRKIKIIL